MLKLAQQKYFVFCVKFVTQWEGRAFQLAIFVPPNELFETYAHNQFQEKRKQNINRLMSEELLSNDRRVEKFWPLRDSKYWPPDPKPHALTTRHTCTDHSVRAIEITQKWRTKAWKSHLRSQRMFQKKSAKCSSEKFALKRPTRLQ